MVTGPLAQAATLVSYTISALNGRFDADAVHWPSLSAFRHVNGMTFVRNLGWWRSDVIAHSPTRWIVAIGVGARVSLHLHGGRDATWEIRIKSARRNSEEVWHSHMTYVGDRLDYRVWDVTFVGEAQSRGDSCRPVLDVPTARANLSRALGDVAAKAHAAKFLGWESRFIEAYRALNEATPLIPYHPEMIASSNLEVRQLAAAAMRSWMSGAESVRDAVVLSNSQRRAVLDLADTIRLPALDSIVAAVNAG